MTDRMTSKTTRHPDRCPAHRDDHRVRTEYQPAGWGTARLIQHWCGHDDCSEPLGWQFEQRGAPNRVGPGQCDDPQVSALLVTIERDEATGCITIALLCLTLLAGLLIAAGWGYMETVGRAFAIAGGTITLMIIPLTLWIRAKMASADAAATGPEEAAL